MDSKKLSFHLPRFRVENGNLIAIDYFDLRNSFINKIQSYEPDYILSEVKKVIALNHEYDVEIITVYISDDSDTKICKVFLDTICKFAESSAEVEEYHYEIDDLHIKVIIGKSDINDSALMQNL